MDVGWMDGCRVDRQISGQISEYMGGQVGGIDGCVDEWKDGWMDGQLSKYIKEWLNRQEEMNGERGSWTGVCEERQMMAFSSALQCRN